MILFFTTADTELLTLRHAVEGLPVGMEVGAANPADFADRESLEHFLAERLPRARLVVLRLLGGRKAFPAFDSLTAYCRRAGIPLIAWPGDPEPDPDLQEVTSVDRSVADEALRYLMHGGVENLLNLLTFLSDRVLGTRFGYAPAKPLPWFGIYRPEVTEALSRAEFDARFPAAGRATVGILFYRAHWMSRNLQFVDALLAELEHLGCRAMPVFGYSLKPEKDGGLPAVFQELLLPDGGVAVDVLISTLSFAAGRVDAGTGRLADAFAVEAFQQLDVPILQAIVSTGDESRWQESRQGLSPIDTAMNVAMPEFDGRIITVPFSFKEEIERHTVLGTPIRRYRPVPDRVRFVARLARNYARLRRKPNAEKRIAILLTNYPAKNSRIGNAVGLDTPASVVRILEAMARQGYQVGPIPETGDALIAALTERCTNDRSFLSEQELALLAGHLDGPQYRRRFAQLPDENQSELRRVWGEPPGSVLTYKGDVVVPGLQLGNVFVGLQPPRGFGDNPIAVYHSPDLIPTHQYIGYYQWLREVFQADAVVHVGKHGTLEWLPGKGIGLSSGCYPEIVLDDLPNFYPYIINNPGEGTQAKRRSHATIIDHMIPPMTRADSYGALARLEQLLDQYYQAQTLDPSKLEYVQEAIWETIRQAELDRDLGQEERPSVEAFDDFLAHVDGYLCELKAAQIRDGLHILGVLPEQPETLADLLLLLTRLPNGRVPALPSALADYLGLAGALEGSLGRRFSEAVPAVLRPFLPKTAPSVGDVRLAVEGFARQLLLALLEALHQGRDGVAAAMERLPARQGGGEGLLCVLRYVADTLLPRLRETEREIDWLLHGLEGRFVPPGPSGAPTRGMADILPTGRNFYAIDPRAIPSEAAWQVGQKLADSLLARHLAETGRHPESVAIVVWGTAAMRTQGDDIAEALALLGVRPVWQPESRRVIDLEVIPLEQLGRPRIDVVVRMSGFFRDAFPNAIHLLDRAVRLVARLPEPPEANFVRKHVDAERAHLTATGMAEAAALDRALLRIFGAKPGAYGSGLLPLIEGGNWRTTEDLARVYLTWSGYAYTESEYGRPAEDVFADRLRLVEVATKNQDNREHDIFDSDDYFQDHGGMIATIRALTGNHPRSYFGDSHDPERVVVRDLAEEARRVFRSRVVNPKWLNAMERHGYKGALEMAATVDYLFGYDATAGVVEDWMYRDLTRAYLADARRRRFLREKNPWALKDIAERLLEAAGRGLWSKPEAELLAEIEAALQEAEASLEGGEEEA